MLILLDCRPLQHLGPGNERSRLILFAVRQLSLRYPLQWLFVLERGGRMLSEMTGLEGQRVELKALPGGIGWKRWYDWQLPRLAKKQGVELIMTTDGRTAGGRGFPQCCWMPYGAKLKDLTRAGLIFCFSEDDKQRVIKRLASPSPVAEDRVRVIHAASPLPLILSADEKQQQKALYGGGREYFFSDITGLRLSAIVPLLKAFSLFKKRQRSNMKFLLTGTAAGLDKALAESLENYKFREDIQWVSHPAAEECAGIMSGAYAVVCCAREENIGLAVLGAWQAGLPAISLAATGITEGKDAFLQVEKEGDITQLAEYLKLLYKDEAFRAGLITKGLQQAACFTGQRLADEVWAGISAIKS